MIMICKTEMTREKSVVVRDTNVEIGEVPKLN
jgi:hypothetical protein